MEDCNFYGKEIRVKKGPKILFIYLCFRDVKCIILGIVFFFVDLNFGIYLM